MICRMGPVLSFLYDLYHNLLLVFWAALQAVGYPGRFESSGSRKPPFCENLVPNQQQQHAHEQSSVGVAGVLQMQMQTHSQQQTLEEAERVSGGWLWRIGKTMEDCIHAQFCSSLLDVFSRL